MTGQYNIVQGWNRDGSGQLPKLPGFLAAYVDAVAVVSPVLALQQSAHFTATPVGQFSEAGLQE